MVGRICQLQVIGEIFQGMFLFDSSRGYRLWQMPDLLMKTGLRKMGGGPPSIRLQKLVVQYLIVGDPMLLDLCFLGHHTLL